MGKTEEKPIVQAEIIIPHFCIRIIIYVCIIHALPVSPDDGNYMSNICGN